MPGLCSLWTHSAGGFLAVAFSVVCLSVCPWTGPFQQPVWSLAEQALQVALWFIKRGLSVLSLRLDQA